MDRRTGEATPQGAISYGYDAAGRRTSVTVAGQPQVTYGYDDANRLRQISQGTTTVGFGYDDANRRSTLTLSNGVNVSYSYDNDSRLTGITYKFNANTLGDLMYTYDELGRHTQVGGSFARTGFPGAVASGTYDAANELTNWNGTLISYDLNGNMLSDGSNAFTWNARNQVASLNGVSLRYDAFGRRTQNALGTSFLYDDANSTQELSGSTVTANLLTGGIDEMFSRADSSETVTPLQDALESTIALVDASGNLSTQYTYDPFGNTTITGVANANVYQYTGRENENGGFYFYRARYYSPELNRLISQDPAGFRGGINSYVYAYESHLSFRDPSGLKEWQDFYNNPIMDFLANHADSLPGICSGGFFGYLGGGPQVGSIYQGTYAFKNWDVDFKDLSHPTVHADPVGVLGEVGADVPGGEAGVGSVVGRKGVTENFLFVGEKAGPFAAGPLVGASTENGLNPLYNQRYIGLFREINNHVRPTGWPEIGPQVAAGGGFYLTVSTAAGCMR